MFDFLLDGGLLLGMAGLLMAISLIAGRLSNSMISRAESADAPAAPDVYGQHLVEAYINCRR